MYHQILTLVAFVIVASQTTLAEDQPPAPENESTWQQRWALAQNAPTTLCNPPATGLFVFDLLPGSPAEVAGLKIGDILTHYDGQPVATHADLSRLARVANNDKREEVLLILNRDGTELDRTIPPGPMGLRLEDVRQGEQRRLPDRNHAATQLPIRGNNALPQIQSGGPKWSRIYSNNPNKPIGWARQIVLATKDNNAILRMQQLLHDGNLKLAQDILVTFAPFHQFQMTSLRITVNNKLSLDVRRAQDRFLGTRVGVPIEVQTSSSAVSAYLVPFVAAWMAQNNCHCWNCEYIPPGSLEAAPLSQITIETTRATPTGNNSIASTTFTLRKLGRVEMQGELDHRGEIGIIRLRDGLSIQPATAQDVLTDFPDAQNTFPPIEQLPTPTQEPTSRAN